MATMTTNQIGRLAELLAAAALSRPTGPPRGRPLFRATPLGDKYPAVDFLVDLVDRNDASRGFFFAQVKGTASAKPTTPRLPIDVARDRFNRFAGITAPTYLLGVDVRTEVTYLVSAWKARRSPVSSISKAFSLDEDSVKVKLYQEVLAFWNAHKPLLYRTGFKDV